MTTAILKRMSDDHLQALIASTAYVTADGKSGFVEAAPETRQMALDEVALRWRAGL